MSTMDNAKPFVTEFNRAYDEHTQLKNVCTHRYYGDEDREESSEEEREASRKNDDSLDYYQIGRHTSVPVSLVEDGRFRYVSETAADALAEGEKSFFAERLDAFAENEEVAQRTADPSSVVAEGQDAVGESDLIMLPRSEKYDKVVGDWKEEGKVRRFGDSEYYVDEEVESDCWLYRFDGPDSAFVLNTEDISVVQKKGDATLRPTDFVYDGDADSLNDGVPVSVYFGEERYAGNGDYEEFEEFFDLLYRVVVSEPIVDEEGVCKVVLN